jgi:phosphoribosylformylglycinamidine synthase
MWQLSEAIDGMAEACRGLGLPVIGGNVSLYNESAGIDIDPTPVLGVLGLVEELRAPPPGVDWADGDAVVLLGRRAAADHPGGAYPLAGSRWAAEVAGERAGTLPPLDLAAHRSLVELVAGLVAETVAGGAGVVHGAHDVSAGGLAGALAELAVTAGTGCVVSGLSGPAELFSELPSRIVVATARPDEVVERATAAGVPAAVLGRVGGDRLVVDGLVDLALGALAETWSAALPVALGEER